MSLSSCTHDSGGILISSGPLLTIETAAEFSRLLRESLETSTDVMVEFDPAVAIDLTGLQLLCSACKTAAAQGRNLSRRGASPPALDDIIEACGARRHATCKQNTDANCPWFGGTE